MFILYGAQLISHFNLLVLTVLRSLTAHGSLKLCLFTVVAAFAGGVVDIALQTSAACVATVGVGDVFHNEEVGAAAGRGV